MAGFDLNSLQASVGNAGTGAFNVLTTIIIFIILALIIFGVLYLIKWMRRYNIPVTIFDHTVIPAIVDHDMAAYIKERVTQMVTLRLKDYKILLSADHIPFQGGKNKEVFLVRTSKTEFRFWTPPVSLEKTYENSIGLEDVTNASIQHQRNLKLRNVSLMSQLMQYAPIAISCALLLIMLIIVGRFLPDILTKMAAETTAQTELAKAIKEVLQTQCGTTIVPAK